MEVSKRTCDSRRSASTEGSKTAPSGPSDSCTVGVSRIHAYAYGGWAIGIEVIHFRMGQVPASQKRGWKCVCCCHGNEGQAGRVGEKLTRPLARRTKNRAGPYPHPDCSMWLLNGSTPGGLPHVRLSASTSECEMRLRLSLSPRMCFKAGLEFPHIICELRSVGIRSWSKSCWLAWPLPISEVGYHSGDDFRSQG